MRTTRSLPYGVSVQGVSVQRVSVGGRVLCLRGPHGQRPPPQWREWHTQVKILPCPKPCLRAVIKVLNQISLLFKQLNRISLLLIHTDDMRSCDDDDLKGGAFQYLGSWCKTQPQVFVLGTKMISFPQPKINDPLIQLKLIF